MTFRAPAEKWAKNAGPVKATRAMLESPDGQWHPGVRIKQESTGGWMVLTEAHAVSVATQILDVIDFRRHHEAGPAGKTTP